MISAGTFRRLRCRTATGALLDWWELFSRIRTGVTEISFAQAIDYPHRKVVLYQDLAREPRVRTQVFFARKPRLLACVHFACVTGEYFYTTCRAARVAATAMQNVDPAIH